MRYIVCLMALVCACVGSMWAYDLKSNRLYYNIVDAHARTIALTCQHPYHAKVYSRMRSMRVPATVTYRDTTYTVVGIDSLALHDCPNLERIYLPEGLVYIDSAAMADCLSLDSVILPSTLRRIGPQAFYHCTTLREIHIPAGVDTIGAQAFALGRMLRRISVDEANTHYDSRDNCQGICHTPTNTLIATGRRTSIPAGVRTIGAQVWAYSPTLTNIVIPEGVEHIGEMAFAKCDALDSVSLPHSLRSMGPWAFLGCQRIRHVNIGDSLRGIPALCFYECSDLREISIPAGCHSVGEQAFRLSGIRTATLADGVDSIAPLAFAQCRFLHTIVLPRSIRYIAPNALAGCTQLQHICVADKAEKKRITKLLPKEYKKIITL